MASVINRLPGLRIPGAWDWFEVAIRAILGQQITVKAARTIAGRIVKKSERRCMATQPNYFQLRNKF